MYPATLADLQVRVSQFDLLADRSNSELQQSLDLARGEIELECPAAYDNTLDGRLDRAAWGLMLDVAVWHLRVSVERDAETGAPPRDLTEWRRTLDERILRLGRAAARGSGEMSFEAYDGLGDAPTPGEILDSDDDDD